MRLTTTLALLATILLLSCGLSFLGYRYLLLSSEYRQANLYHLEATHNALDLLLANPVPREDTREELRRQILRGRDQAVWCIENLSGAETRIFERLGAGPALAICQQDIATADKALHGLQRIETALAGGFTGTASPFAEALRLRDHLVTMRADSLAFQPYVDVIEGQVTRFVTIGTLLANAALGICFVVLSGQLFRAWQSQDEQTQMLERVNQRFTLAMQASSDGFAIFDSDARLIACNDQYRAYSHPDPEAVQIGMTAGDIVSGALSSGFYAPDSAEAFRQAHDMAAKGRLRLDSAPEAAEQTLELSGNRYMLVRRRKTDYGDVLVTRTEITEQVLNDRRQRDYTEELKGAKQEIETRSLTDPLTGLANRRKLDHELARRIAEGPTVLIRIDLDRFKQVNDLLGHDAGDFVLCHVADILRTETRKSDLSARVGGDEFVILCDPQVDEAAAEALAKRVLERVLEPLHYGSKRCIYGASFGIATGTGDEAPDDLLRNADAALYQSKADGRGTVTLFTPEMRRKTVRDRALAEQFADALEEGQIVPFFQSQHRAGSLEFSGAEVLARWQHPELGVLSPVDFMPIAQQLGMEAQLDAAIFRHTVKALAAFDSAGLNVPRVSLNVSLSRIMDPLFVMEICEILHEDRERYIFEVVESVSHKDAREELGFVIEALKVSGFQIYLDDFGSGHASINSVFDIEPDGLKIDRALITPLGTCERAEILVSSILDLAHSLGAHSIAEGVDDAATAAILAEMGCEFVQGFAFSRPMSAADFRGWLCERGPNREALLQTGTT